MIIPIQVEAVYFVETQNNVANPIAIRPVYDGKYVSWEDTSRNRMIEPTKVLFDDTIVSENLKDLPETKIPESIDIITGENSKYHLIKMTLKVFNEKVKDKVAAPGGLDFKTDKDVQEYYLNTNFYAFY